MTYTFTTPTTIIRWMNGTHTANVFDVLMPFEEIDTFTFAWHKDSPDVVDFTEALASRVADDATRYRGGC